jgi:hypothetical protein
MIGELGGMSIVGFKDLAGSVSFETRFGLGRMQIGCRIRARLAGQTDLHSTNIVLAEISSPKKL